MSEKREIIKIVLLGNEFENKKQFVHRYMGEGFKQSFEMKMGSDFAVKRLQVDEKDIVFRIWELKGNIRFQSVREVYYGGALGIILVFDLNDIVTLEALPSWITETMENNQNRILPMLLVGLQPDSSRIIDYTTGVEYAKSLSDWSTFEVPYFEVNFETKEVRCNMGYRTIDDGLEHLVKLIL